MIRPDGEGDKVKFCDKIDTGRHYTKNWEHLHPYAKDKGLINSSQNADLNVRIMHEVNRKNSELVHYSVLDTHFLSRTQASLSFKMNLYS